MENKKEGLPEDSLEPKKFSSIEEALNFGMSILYNLDNQGNPASSTSGMSIGATSIPLTKNNDCRS